MNGILFKNQPIMSSVNTVDVYQNGYTLRVPELSAQMMLIGSEKRQNPSLSPAQSHLAKNLNIFA